MLTLNIGDMTTYQLATLLSIPVISGAIGWITNYLAVKMIFRPHRPWTIFGLITVQGLVPRRQAELAKSIGEVVERELVSHSDIERVLTDPAVHHELNRRISAHIDQLIKEKLATNPLFAMVLQGGFVEGIRDYLASHFTESLPEFVQVTVDHLQSRLDFQQLVEEKIIKFDLAKLEAIIYRISARELKSIEYLGGVLGFFIGLIQVAILLAAETA